MKVQAYVLTFLAYTLLHSIRTSYAFSKPYIKTTYDLSNLFLSVLDASIYMMLGVGFLLRFIYVNQAKMLLYFVVTSVICASGIILIAVLSISGIVNATSMQFVLVIGLLAFGFFQHNIWPTLLAIIQNYFSNSEHGSLIGFWSSSADVGNVIGFVVSSVFILQMHISWQIPLLVLPAIFVSICVWIYLSVRLREEKSLDYSIISQDGNEQNGSSTPQWTEFCEYVRKCFRSLKTILFLISGCLFKSMLYTFLLWLPTYIDSKGQKGQSALVPIIFNISAIIGSLLLGKLYENSINAENIFTYKHIQYLLACLSLIVIACLIVLVNLEQYNLIVFGLILSLTGFVIGGIFNILTTNETLKIASNKTETKMMSTLFMGAANFTTGVTELIVGLYLTIQQDNDSSNGYGGVFEVLLIISILSTLILCLRSYVISKQQDQQPV